MRIKVEGPMNSSLVKAGDMFVMWPGEHADIETLMNRDLMTNFVPICVRGFGPMDPKEGAFLVTFEETI